MAHHPNKHLFTELSAEVELRPREAQKALTNFSADEDSAQIAAGGNLQAPYGTAD